MTEIPSAAFDEAADHPWPLLFATVSGAHLYGFESSDSDVDVRGCHTLPFDRFAGLEPGPFTVERDGVRDGVEVDSVTHDASKFFAMLLRPNGYVLEQVFSPLVVHDGGRLGELRDIAADCVTRNHAHHYLGFAASRRKLIAKSDGPPGSKPLLYLARVLMTGLHLMRTGEVEADLRRLLQDRSMPAVDELLAFKRAGVEKEAAPANLAADVSAACDAMTRELETARDRSTLREHPAGRERLNDLLLEIRSQTT